MERRLRVDGGVEDERGVGSGTWREGTEGRGTSVVCTTPWTTTSVPGGGNWCCGLFIVGTGASGVSVDAGFGSGAATGGAGASGTSS